MSEDYQAQDDVQTEHFLQTNGPEPGAFAPDIPEPLLAQASEIEKFLLRKASKTDKQNDWLIKETIGLKGAHRSIRTRLGESDRRFANIDATLDVFTKLRDGWLTRRKFLRNAVIGLFTLLILPFFSLLLVEVIKHFLHWQ